MAGIGPSESGLSSALLNVGQQLGGSTGLAVLGTIAATVTKNDLANVLPSPAIISHAITSGYGTAFGIAGAIAVASLLIAVATVTNRRQATTIEAVSEAA